MSTQEFNFGIMAYSCHDIQSREVSFMCKCINVDQHMISTNTEEAGLERNENVLIYAATAGMKASSLSF